MVGPSSSHALLLPYPMLRGLIYQLSELNDKNLDGWPINRLHALSRGMLIPSISPPDVFIPSPVLALPGPAVEDLNQVWHKHAVVFSGLAL